MTLRIIFFGTPEFAVPTLERLLVESDVHLVAVVTQPDRRRGRGNEILASPIKRLAEARGLPVWQPEKIKRDPEILAKLAQSQADAFVVVAYGQILSQKILNLPRLGCVNAHGSLLPAYRGAAPIQRCLAAGDRHTGIVTMLMTRGMDAGPELLRAETPIDLLDHADSLASRLAELAAELMIQTLRDLAAGRLTPQPQDEAQATYAPPIEKEDYLLQWNRSAIALHNQIRGFYPHCVSQFRGSPLKLLATAPLGPEFWSHLPLEFSPIEHLWPALEPQWEAVEGPPGTIVGIIKNVGPVVRTQAGYLLLRQVIPAGKRPQSGWDFANGSHLKAGECLG